MLRLALAISWSLIGALSLQAADWPQWMGPTRDGVWTEDGILERFPEKGPVRLWTAKVAGGYAGPAVAEGKVFVTDFVRAEGVLDNNPSKRSTHQGTERVLCLDAANGKELWKHEYQTTYKVSYACGPRCTPTYHAGKVYTLGTMGNLNCLNAKDGKVVWSKDFTTDYKAEVPIWGFCGHPLIEGDHLICLVGGEGSTVVAFHKDTGKEVWKALSTLESGYCPPTIIEHAGKRMLLIWHSTEIVAMDPKTGDKHWSVKLAPKYGMSICAPQISAGHLYAGGIGAQSVMLKLENGLVAPKEVWRGQRTNSVYPSICTPIMHDNVMYSCDSFTGSLIAVDIATGNRHWETDIPTTGKGVPTPHGSAFITRNGSHYFLFNETGHLIITKLTPKNYQELGRVKLLEATGEAFGRKVVWSHPAYANKCIFSRNDEQITCHSLAK